MWRPEPSNPLESGLLDTEVIIDLVIDSAGKVSSAASFGKEGTAHAALLSAYDGLKSSLVPGFCGDTKGQKTWIHKSTGKTGGVRVCGSADNGDSMVVWTHEKLGNYDHVDMLGVARASGRGANLYRSWWGAIKDDVGKCRPLLPTNICNATVQKFEK